MRLPGRELDPRVVRKRMKEYRKSPEAFFQKYGGGESVKFDLIDEDGNRYPPAAIVQASLDWVDVKGGLRAPDSAGQALRANGFRVVGKRKAESVPSNVGGDLLRKLQNIEKTTRVAKSRTRIGADILREYALLHKAECEVTGISEAPLLRVSHIVAWKDNEASRLDPANVILLSALWDSAFDKGLVSFTDDGTPLFSPALSPFTKIQLESTVCYEIAVSEKRGSYLGKHRAKFGFTLKNV